MAVPKHYVLALAPAEASAVRRALGALPHDAVQGLIANVESQMAQQNEAAEAQVRTPPE